MTTRNHDGRHTSSKNVSLAQLTRPNASDCHSMEAARQPETFQSMFMPAAQTTPAKSKAFNPNP